MALAHRELIVRNQVWDVDLLDWVNQTGHGDAAMPLLPGQSVDHRVVIVRNQVWDEALQAWVPMTAAGGFRLVGVSEPRIVTEPLDSGRTQVSLILNVDGTERTCPLMEF